MKLCRIVLPGGFEYGANLYIYIKNGSGPSWRQGMDQATSIAKYKNYSKMPLKLVDISKASSNYKLTVIC